MFQIFLEIERDVFPFKFAFFSKIEVTLGWTEFQNYLSRYKSWSCIFENSCACYKHAAYTVHKKK